MRHFAFAAAIAAGFALPALADPTIETAKGPVELTAVPQKVIALDSAAIDTLQALEVPLLGLPEPMYLDYIKTDGTTPVGTLFEPNLETIAGLAPDLIVIGGRSAAKYDAVAQIAPTVDMTMSADLLPEAAKRLATYGELFGKQEKATELQTELDGKLAKLREAAAGKGKMMVVLTNGPKMSAYGKGSRFGWLYEATGMEEAAEALPISGHGASITQEFIAEKNPDWLLVLDRAAAINSDEQGAKVTLDTPLVQGTKAWQAGNVVYLPESAMYIGGGGIQALNRTVDALTEALSK